MFENTEQMIEAYLGFVQDHYLASVKARQFLADRNGGDPYRRRTEIASLNSELSIAEMRKSAAEIVLGLTKEEIVAHYRTVEGRFSDCYAKTAA